MTGNLLCASIFVQDLKSLDEIINKYGLLLRNSEGKMKEGIGLKLRALNAEVVNLARKISSVEKDGNDERTPDIRNAGFDYRPKCIESKLIFDVLLSIDAYRDEIDRTQQRGKTLRLKNIGIKMKAYQEELSEIIKTYGGKE